jgi:hypothetical protein
MTMQRQHKVTENTIATSSSSLKADYVTAGPNYGIQGMILALPACCSCATVAQVAMGELIVLVLWCGISRACVELQLASLLD